MKNLKKIALFTIIILCIGMGIFYRALADNPQYWCQFSGTAILRPCTGTPSVQTTNSSTTNFTLLGPLFDSTQSKGTIGQLLQSTGSVTKWVATSTLGFQPAGNYVTSVGGSGNINSSGGTTPNITLTGIIPVGNGGTGSSSLNTTLVAEGNNLYFTNARAQNAITLTTSGTSGSATYSGGILNIPIYTGAGGSSTTVVTTASAPYLQVAQSGTNATLTLASVLSLANSASAGGINFSSATGTGITGALNSLNISQFTNNSNYISASSTLIAGGTATFSPSVTIATSSDTNIAQQWNCTGSTCTDTSQWLGTLAAGRLNSNVVQTLATGTTGTIFNGSISAQTLTLNLPFASSVNTGQLQSSDWTTFNNKENAFTVLPVANGGTGAPSLTANDVLFGNGTSPIATSSNFTFSSANNNLFVTNASTTNLTVATKTILNNASTTAETDGTLNVTGNLFTNLTNTSIPIVGTGGLLQNSSLSQSAGTTLINGTNPIIDGGGDWLNNVIQTSGANVIVQAPTSTAQLGNVVLGGGVNQLNATTYLTPTQFCSGGLFYLSSTTAFNIYLPTLTQLAPGQTPSNCTNNIYSGDWSPQYVTNANSAPVTVNASGTGETLLYAPGSGPTLYPGQTWFQSGQFVASSTIVGSTSTGMSLNTFYSNFQPTSTAPSTMGQILSADATGHGWQLTNLVAGSNVTINTSTPGQITIASTGGSGSPAGSPGQVQYNSAGSFGGSAALLTNGTVSGVNATSSTYSFNIQGTGTQNLLNLASSTGVSQFNVDNSGNITALGSLTLPSQINFNSSVFTQFQATVAGVNLDFKTVAGNGNIIFTPNAVDTLDITHTQEVGINTDTPNSTLFVEGTGNYNPFTVASSSGISELNITPGGLIGIGTTTATALLTVQSTPTFTGDLLDLYASSTLVASFASSSDSSVDIGTTTLSAVNLAVVDSIANASTTVQTGSPTSPACHKDYEPNGTAIYWYFNNSGAIATSTTSSCKSGF